MRQRTLKPGFFKNEDLCEMPMSDRLLFAGLFLLADREGRFEDRPARIRAEVFPYDLDVDVSAAMTRLAAKGFVLRYEVGGKRYGLIPTFAQHQRPHPKEMESVIPAPAAGYDQPAELHGEDAHSRVKDAPFPSFPSGSSIPSGSSGSSWARKPVEVVDEKAAAEIDEIRTDHTAEESRLTANLIAIRDGGEDVQAALDSTAEKGRKPYSAYGWLRNGRSGVPETRAGVTVLRLLNAALEARQRAQAAPIISDSMKQTMEALQRSGDRIRARMAAEGRKEITA